MAYAEAALLQRLAMAYECIENEYIDLATDCVLVAGCT